MSKLSPSVASIDRRLPEYDTGAMPPANTDLTGLSADIDEFYAECNTNNALILDDAFKDGVTRYLTIKNTHATDSISITLPERFGSESPLEIENGFYGVIQFSYHLQISKWFIIAQSFENIEYSAS